MIPVLFLAAQCKVSVDLTRKKVVMRNLESIPSFVAARSLQSPEPHSKDLEASDVQGQVAPQRSVLRAPKHDCLHKRQSTKSDLFFPAASNKDCEVMPT